MKYDMFAEKMKVEVSLKLGTNISVELNRVKKNNGTYRQGLTLVEKGSTISPTIYLEEYYEQYNGGRIIEDLVVRFLDTYDQIRNPHFPDADKITDYSWVKQHLAYRLVNYEKNKELLTEVPYMTYLDLAMVYYIVMDQTEAGMATVLVKNQNMKQWNITLEMLAKHAKKNTVELMPMYFKSMSEVIHEMMDMEYDLDHEDEGMYVLSNEKKNYGAAVIAYPYVLENIWDLLEEDYYVLPSSVHEVIVLRKSVCTNPKDLKQMICEINETEVDPEEVLSDRPYFYSKKEGRLLY